MGRTLRACCLAAMFAASATAQQSTSSVPTPTSSVASSVTSVPSSSITVSPESTMGIPLSLWSVATSLLTHYFPSTTITNVRSLDWPSVMVIGTKTYTVHTSHTKTPSPAKATGTAHTTHTGAAASDIGSKATVNNSHQLGDKTLSIVIGVVVGVVALAIMGIIFFCLHQRKKRTGSLFLRRQTPSPRMWTPPTDDPEHYGNVSYVTAGAAHHDRQPKMPQVSVMQQRGPTPPLNMHPAAMYDSSSRSTSNDDPFLTPMERSTAELDSHHVQHAELDHQEPAQRRSSTSIRDSRPPTPFSPLMMSQMPGPSQRPQLHVNPFASTEDREAEDVISPILPSKSPERRYSPIVHYPSWDEVNDFNFSGNERGKAPVNDGSDAYRSHRERKSGRYELA